MFHSLLAFLRPGGRLALAQTVPAATQRIYALLDRSGLPGDLAQAWQAAEEAICADADDALVNWQAEDLRHMALAAACTGERGDGRRNERGAHHPRCWRIGLPRARMAGAPATCSAWRSRWMAARWPMCAP
ncbi:hypothetical protein [Candidatus Amarobacter glycogenicus]|uniref:hypothetical protein n=1 Tax=Candidatus Amarobacter glycogenicus TaxID=3140699 RepID=UPI003134E64A|nr:hypothetical protein [Dehalococcoidia bacterium]